MVRALVQSDFAQPTGGFRFDLLPCLPSKQQRHGNIFRRREFRQQIVKLPYKAGLPIAKGGSFVVRQRIHSQVGAVYVTFRSTIKGAQDVQKGTLAGTRFADDRNHLPTLHFKRQILKEHQVRLAGPEDFLQAFHPKD